MKLFKAFGAFSFGVLLVYIIWMIGFFASYGLNLRTYINQPIGEFGIGCIVFGMALAAISFVVEVLDDGGEA